MVATFNVVNYSCLFFSNRGNTWFLRQGFIRTKFLCILTFGFQIAKPKLSNQKKKKLRDLLKTNGHLAAKHKSFLLQFWAWVLASSHTLCEGVVYQLKWPPIALIVALIYSMVVPGYSTLLKIFPQPSTHKSLNGAVSTLYCIFPFHLKKSPARPRLN